LIIYQANKTEFLNHAFRDDIEDVVSRHYGEVTGRTVGPSELQAWKNSLLEMAKVLQDEDIPSDIGVAIEYQLPQSSKRIDFVIAGEDEQARSAVIIIELKQWSESRRSEKDAIVWARRGGRTGEREGPHPSYQAWSYAAYLRDFNTAVQDENIDLRPCAYLHNHPRDGEIDHPHYKNHIDRAPLFLQRERSKLQAFIRTHVRRGDRRKALYSIENGRIQPSKMLADSVKGMLQGKTEFLMIDDQKVVYESVLTLDATAHDKKQVVIVQGGPGTGKSVLAVNLLSSLLQRKRNVRYVSKNAAPREVYQTKLTGTFTRTYISNLFSGSGAFIDVAENSYDALIVDEAHRLNAKSGLYGNLGDNQIREVIRAARCTVFFIDDDQRVTLRDIGHTDKLRELARAAGAEITELELSSQFRCNGSDGYLAWIDSVLDIRQTANEALDTAEYDFRVFDSPTEMHALIEARNRANNRSRVVAGYCWKWGSKKDPLAWDIVMDEFLYKRRWNLGTDGSLWIVAPESVSEVGCIHTCQGLELDYVGVIIGPDMVFRDERIVTDTSKRASSDQSVKGIKKMIREDRDAGLKLGDLIVKNTYRTLMTRGMKGCYVYCTDSALATHLRSRLIGRSPAIAAAPSPDVSAAGPRRYGNLRLVSSEERSAGAPALPIIDLRIADKGFAGFQSMEDAAEQWAKPPDWITPQKGMFVAQVIDASNMDRPVPSGSWCLFRAVPATGFESGVAEPDAGDEEQPMIPQFLTLLPQ
jgi:DUF2075 family protein